MFSSIIDDINVDNIDITSFMDAVRDAGTVALFTFGGFLLFSLIIAIVVARKAGYSGWWGAVVVLVPVIGTLVFIILALLKWPALKQRDEAMRVLKDHGIPLPSQQRLAEREAEARAKLEADAQRRAEQARMDREKAERTRDEMRAQNQPAAVAAAPAAAPPATTPATPPPAPAEKPASKPSTGTTAAKKPAAKKPTTKTPASKPAASTEEPTKDA
ncbi:MAG: hypothetical protein CVT64_02280 [Actinobacteria bacterium HGW-Actinobacteria-4]|nr:MAG: hypothetical protein CVT64_02280 [Actinobacteria bacterium HGW-Actinobacteria-4]